MKYFKVRFSLHSSILTSFQSDTIFGHLAWGWRYLKGNDAIKDLLHGLDQHPILVSDAFPLDFLPKPVISPISSNTRRQMAIELGKRDGKFCKSEMIAQLARFKEAKKIPYLTAVDFVEIAGRLSRNALLKCLLTNDRHKIWESKTEVIGHNTINRITGTVQENGGFHPQIETFYGKGSQFWCWISGDYWSKDNLSELWSFIEYSGYGADSSTGKGRIKIEAIEETELIPPDNTNAVVSLSTFIPNEKCPIDCNYEVLVKFGRLGSMYSLGKNFYKSAVMMLKPGTVIKHSRKPQDFYGTSLKNVNWDTEVIQYGHMFPYPVKIPEDEL